MFWYLKKKVLRRDDAALFSLLHDFSRNVKMSNFLKKHLDVSRKSRIFAAMNGKFYYMIIVVLTCLACNHEQREANFGTEEECRYDAMQLDGDWEGIVAEAQNSPVQSLACHKVIRLAQFRLKQIDSEAAMECLANTKESLTSVTGTMMMSDVYLHMGFPNISQRAAFEVLESTSNYNMSGRELSRLVETALITGQYEVALKYISLLESTLFYRNWAKQMRELAAHPETIKRVPFYGPLQDIYGQTVDVNFF